MRVPTPPCCEQRTRKVTSETAVLARLVIADLHHGMMALLSMPCTWLQYLVRDD
jgi:hypothetical protein